MQVPVQTFTKFMDNLAELLKTNDLSLDHIYQLSDLNLATQNTLVAIHPKDETNLDWFELQRVVEDNIYDYETYLKNKLILNSFPVQQIAVVEVLPDSSCNVYVKGLLEGLWLKKSYEGL